MKSVAAPQARFSFIDGLRGIAALAVVLPHSRGLFAFPEGNAVTKAMLEVCEYGGRGVQIFFVISGFVIAYSLREANRRSFSLKTFILRRSVRLDPPYWVALFAIIGAKSVQALMTHKPLALPTTPTVLASLFYLQDILGYGQVNVVFWTLCVEFQLYIVFALLLVVSERLAKPERLDDTVRPNVVIACFLGSLALSHTVWPNDGPGTWFVPYWYMFLSGVLLCWHVLGRVSRRQLVFCAACMVAAFAWHHDSFKLSAILASGVVYLAIHLGKLSTWLAGRTAQLFGRLSYCIYLLHVPVALFALAVRTRVSPTSNVLPFVILGVLYVAIVVAAFVLHVTVEKPCLRLAARLKRRAPPPLDAAAPSAS